eukprot:scaffold61125_cov41-Tisochrysis_lutea.AAC.2
MAGLIPASEFGRSGCHLSCKWYAVLFALILICSLCHLGSPPNIVKEEKSTVGEMKRGIIAMAHRKAAGTFESPALAAVGRH